MTVNKQHPSETAEAAPRRTMRAVVRTTYGSVDVVRAAEVPVPAVGDGDVLVRVHAAGLDRGVWHVMTGLPYAGRLAFGLRRPKQPVLGLDVAGTVAAVGNGVTRFAVGDEVYGNGTGTFAEYAAVPEKALAAKPASLTFEQAAVVPVSAVTALKAVRDVGKVRPGQKVLVTGASGGVGSYAVQIAKASGAEVTGVASAAKLDLVRTLGADHVLDYRTEDFAHHAGRYDLIIDIAGNPSLGRLRRALSPTGTAVITGGEGAGKLLGMGRQLRGLALSPFLRQRLTTFVGTVRSEVLEEVTGLIESGAVTPALERTYPLEQAPEAIRRLVVGEIRGKVAIRP